MEYTTDKRQQQFVIEDTVTSHVFVMTVLISRLAVEIIITMTLS
jgi:hypothetical protein